MRIKHKISKESKPWPFEVQLLKSCKPWEGVVHLLSCERECKAYISGEWALTPWNTQPPLIKGTEDGVEHQLFIIQYHFWSKKIDFCSILPFFFGKMGQQSTMLKDHNGDIVILESSAFYNWVFINISINYRLYKTCKI